MPTTESFREPSPAHGSDGAIKMASGERFIDRGLDGVSSSYRFSESHVVAKAERILLDRESTLNQSVVDSTDDGIMTPTVDDSPSDISTHQAPASTTKVESIEVSNPPQYEIKANTHNTTLTDSHIPTIEQLAADLQSAIDGAWPMRARPEYKAVRVLMMSWDEGNPCSWADIHRLRCVFSDLYHFEVEDFRIPTGYTADLVKSTLASFIRENDGKNNLMIVYHAGRVFYGLEDMLREKPMADVLFLCDSCYFSNARSSFPPSTTEVLAACGMDHQCPASGTLSFTNVLIRELGAASAGPPLAVTELHRRLINCLNSLKPEFLRDAQGNVMLDEKGLPRHETLERRTPIHDFLTGWPAKSSILLSPLPVRNATLPTDAEDDWDIWDSSSKKPKRSRLNQQRTAPVASAGPIERGTRTKYPRVLLSVRLKVDCFPDTEPDEDSVWAWAEWLRDIPSGLEPVAIESVYKSTSSTFMILSLPLLVWHMLPTNPAYSFVGFVYSANLQDVPSKVSSAAAHIQSSCTKCSETSVQEINIEREVRRRVEAELVARELSALRKEKEEWSRKHERERETVMARGMTTPGPFSNEPRANAEFGRSKAPIRFKDAVGRKYSFPFHMAATWNGVEELIKQAFLHVDVLGPHVLEGHYDLLCASGDLSGQIILPQVWETLVEPGWEVNMHMWPFPEPPKPIPPPPQRQRLPPGAYSLGPNGRVAPPPSPPPPPEAVQPPDPTALRQLWIPSSSRSAGVSVVNKSKGLSIRDGGRTTRSRRSSCSISESGSERDFVERDEAITLLKSMVTAKRIFVVGRVGTMGYGRRGLIEVSVKPKGEGMQVLNEYGKMFVEKARKMRLEKEEMSSKKSGPDLEVLVDD
ncbi:hypothetical protein ONS95_001332 [Cadophora gregata]|uniref:uncharacterized protein n=1 Tax=Cadophora gregata TaxID=51156 RepID=UPI0026DB039A|nr:uncharacterized protein ONS95_001332 [Cadophora gregata]KAK0129408.1 hypothetical protein ONS95_001332 [Cadophora gregata]